MDYELLADEQLLKLLKSNDGAAFKQIYDRHWKPLFLLALKKVRIKEIAEELVQNIFVGIWHKRKDSDIANLQAYLRCAIKYQVINYIQACISKEKHLRHASLSAELEDNTCENSLLIHELSAAIDNAMMQLPQKTLQVFRLSRFENHSVKEISKQMNISEKAVEYHITRSLKLMRLLLKDFLFF
ncbi:MAG TPA: sigma-70 family RNA polymerase sigma factor [Puia sp.]|jgi:RNA polymerase sigma-70 factor (family 1)|nr:sigma-70 family RNA polymerase sigma factor [Puia sp.]